MQTTKQLSINCDTQGYRSGHNEAVLKTVCPQGRVGSNPTPCAFFCLKTEFKKIKKCLTNEQRFDKINKLSQESKTKNIDNWTVRNLERFWESIRTLQWKLKTFKTVNSDSIWMNELAKFNLTEINFLTWEFDPGSGWTLAACLTHASRTKHFIWFPSGLIILWLSGGRVSNAWVTCLVQGDNSWKRLLIPHKRTASHDAVWKTLVV